MLLKNLTILVSIAILTFAFTGNANAQQASAQQRTEKADQKTKVRVEEKNPASYPKPDKKRGGCESSYDPVSNQVECIEFCHMCEDPDQENGTCTEDCDPCPDCWGGW